MTDIFLEQVATASLPSHPLNLFVGKEHFALAAQCGARYDLHYETDVPADEMRAEFDKIATYVAQNTEPLDSIPTLAVQHRWRWVSAMQKCIRAGDGDGAAKYAFAMYAAGHGEHVIRRLAVIGAEDIGVGDMYALGTVMHMCAYKTWRQNFEPVVVIRAICNLLADAVKSRVLTDILVWLSCGLRYPPESVRNVHDPKKILPLIESDETQLGDRLWAWWAMHGNMQTVANKTDRMKAHDLVKSPALVRHLAERIKMVSQVDLGVGLPLMWSMMSASSSVKVRPDEWKPRMAPVIHGAPPSTYDQHVWEGKASLKYFVKANAPVRDFLDELGLPTEEDNWKQRMRAVSEAVFAVEGGALDRHVVFDGSRRLFWQVIVDYMKSCGIQDRADTEKLLELVEDNLEDLDRIRRKILANP